MTLKRTVIIYFSPTGTTRSVLQAAAEGIPLGDTIEIDLTNPVNENYRIPEDSLTIIGVPVYAGRVPETAVNRLKDITAHGSPCAVVCLYGNREFDDALVELEDLAEELGFHVISAAAFIGEHSYSTEETPIAQGRPDEEDKKKAVEYGRSLMARAGELDSPEDADPEVPGNRPYKERKTPAGVSPDTDYNRCAKCGKCADRCPVNIIMMRDAAQSRPKGCILCNACVKTCPTGARYLDIPQVKQWSKWLHENCADRKEPEIYF
ncbi:4Fe-4S dicluster domain-containing protein [Limisalsivibrio acetivorans]|uniref:4Fe-4S dicluster domain-containing protein n=1 Tax=Limisalsivibrio acetivorans TaxID=1304888 RepID=UPI0003B48D05|nr:4Fe-4S dicluster domain-containing protein [Limisalsivibrio acetivorans]